MSQLPMYPPQQHDVVGPDSQGTDARKITRPWLAYLQSLTTNVVNSVTHTGALVLNRLIVGNGGNDIRAVAGQDGQVPIAATSDGTVQFQNVTGTLPVVVTNSAHGIDISAPTATTGAAGANTDIQYNDGGSFGGDANLTWDKTTQQQVIDGNGTSSALRVSPSMAFTPYPPGNYGEINLSHYVTPGGYIPVSTEPALIWWDDSGDGVNIETYPGQVPPTPITFAKVYGLTLRNGTVSARVFGVGTGPAPGASTGAERNTEGAGAASTLFGEQRGGTRWYIWQDATGAMRYGPARPTEDNSVSDTSGSLFGAGLSAAQVAARVAVGV